MVRATTVAMTLAFLCGPLACDQDQRLAPDLTETLTAPTTSPLATTPLGPISLVTQADFDRLEASWEGRRAAAGLLAVYAALAEGADPRRPADALLLQRTAVLLATGRGQGDWVKRATEIGDRLRTEAAEEPHSLYLQGYLKRIILQAGAGARQMVITSFNSVAAAQIIADWGELLRRAPDYVGPDGHTAAEIAQDIERLKRGLAAYHAEPEGAVPASAGAHASASPGELRAVEHLQRYEASSLTDRRVLCRDRTNAKLTGGASTSEVRIDYRCAVDDGNLGGAAVLLAALAAKDPATDACYEARQLLSTLVGSTRVPAAKALADAGLGRCLPSGAAQP